jgi:hypothetical protein
LPMVLELVRLEVSIVCAGCSLRIGSCGAMLLCWCYACDMRCAARSAEAGVTGGVEPAHQGALVADRSGLVHRVVPLFRVQG